MTVKIQIKRIVILGDMERLSFYGSSDETNETDETNMRLKLHRKENIIWLIGRGKI